MKKIIYTYARGSKISNTNYRNSLFPDCFLDKHFVNSSLDNHLLFANRKRKVFEILEHLL